LTSLPNEIGNCVNLQRLCIDAEQLKLIPSRINREIISLKN
jgi:Leucine-rich repeat (LRR) protein